MYTDKGYGINVLIYRGLLNRLVFRCAENNAVTNEIAGFGALICFPLVNLSQMFDRVW